MSIWRTLSRKFRNNKQAEFKSNRGQIHTGQQPIVEHLEPRLLLSGDSIYPVLSDAVVSPSPEVQVEMTVTAASGINDQIPGIADGLDKTLGKVESSLQTASELTAKLPMIGDKLTEAAKFVRDFRSKIVSDLAALSDPDADAITEALRDGFNELGVLGPDGVTPASGTGIYTWTVDLEKALTNRKGDTHFDQDLAFDIGLSGLGLSVDGTINFWLGWEFTFTFGVTETDGFFSIRGARHSRSSSR